MNDSINTIAANEERLRNKNEILSVQLEKSRFIAEAALQNTLVNNSIEEIELKLPKSDFNVSDKDFVNKALADKNILYMNKIQNHGAEVSVGYISADMNETASAAVMYYINKLSDEICAECVTDYDKAYAIALWVSDNIYYNEDAARAGINFDTISLETTLALHRTTCAGYSNLFSALCEAQGLYCVNLRGSGSSGLAEMQDWDTQPVNHEWNAVYCGDKWYFVDTTWASLNEYINGEENHYDNIDEQYLMMDFYEMSYDHRIDIADHREFFDAYIKHYK
ncbi:MAG: transglutaminase domain-containing protein [Oscillospiraceae bacterium]